MMCAIRIALFGSCLIGLIIIPYSGATVSLETKDNITSFTEGQRVEMLCSISPYNNLMTWYVDNDPYAACVGGGCNSAPNKPYTFQFHFNESAGIFTLTIGSVNSSHAQLVFACDDGNERPTLTFEVTAKVNGSDGGWCILYLLFLLFLIPIAIVIAICWCFCSCCRCCCCYSRNFEDSLKIKIEKLYETGVDITWTDRSFCQCLSRYQIDCRMVGDSPKPKSARGTSFSFSDLQPSTEYIITLSATRLLFSFETQTIYTIAKTLIAQPEQPSVYSEAHETEILLKWETPACRGNPSLKYLVKWRKEGLHRFQEKEVTTTICNFEKLSPAETYDIVVYAINNGQKSIPWIKKIWTKSVTPNIESVVSTAKNCYIQWDPRTSENLHLQYMLEYCLAEDNNWIKYGEILNTRQACLESLRPNKIYKIRVYAIYNSKVLNPPGITFVTTVDESQNTGRDMLDVKQWDTQEHNEESHLPEATRVRANYDSTYNRCDITWNVTRSGKPLSKIQYMLEYTLNNGIEWNKQGIILDEPKTCLESLERNKCYEIRVYAIYQSFIQEVPGKGNFIT